MIRGCTAAFRCVLLASCLSGCAEPAPRSAARSAAEPHFVRQPSPSVGWGMPRFFEVGPHVQLSADTPAVDTTGWPGALLRATDNAPRAYLSASADEQNSVLVYPETDPSGRLRRYALVLPQPKTFSTNGFVTAFWGRSPLLMNFALGAARSFASFTSKTPNGLRQVVPLRALLEPSGVNPQEIENVYELEQSRLDVFEYKGLVPGEPLSFLEFTVYDRDFSTEDGEPTPLDAGLMDDTLSVALIPLRDERWLHRESFETSGYRVVLVSDAAGDQYFLAAPLESRPSWGFGEVTTDLTLGQLLENKRADAGAGSAAALTFEHTTQGSLLSGMVRSKSELPGLLQRGARFLAQQKETRQSMLKGTTLEYAAQAARAFVAAHRSHRDPRMLTRFAHGDARQPNNSTAFSAGLRFGQDLASALHGLAAVQRASHDPALLHALADFAESSLAAMTPSGATLSQHFDQLAIVAEHAENSARSDVFLDNGSIAVAINHRRLLLARGQTHGPALTWGAFGATIDGQSSSVDDPGYAFSVDGASLPAVVSADATALAASRLFDSGSLRVHEAVQLMRGLPAVQVQYRLENRSDQPANLSEARITLADYIDYGAGSNESSQNRYGLAHVADGVRLPVAFWMEGMKSPIWGDNLAPGELDLSEQYRSLGARFVLVFGFDRAQIFFLTRPPERLILHNGERGRGLTRLEARYQARVTLTPHEPYDLPAVLSYTLRAPLQSTDGDAIPDQLQELGPLWTRIVSTGAQAAQNATAVSLETDSGHAALVYAWILAADALDSGTPSPALSALVMRLRRNALRASSFALSSVTELRNQRDWLPTYASGHDYGFHLAIFDWAYRQTCDARYRDAFLAMADDLARPETRGGLQIDDATSPSYGGYLSTEQARANGATSVGDQGIRLWALRIAYERTNAEKYLRSAELFLNHWLRLDPETHQFTGTVLVDEHYRDAGIDQERSPLGHYAVLAGLRAWSGILPAARTLYSAGLAAATGRHLVHALGLSGPRRAIVPREGLADFSDDAEVGGSFLWATTFDPNALHGRFAAQCRRETGVLGSGLEAR